MSGGTYFNLGRVKMTKRIHQDQFDSTNLKGRIRSILVYDQTHISEEGRLHFATLRGNEKVVYAQTLKMPIYCVKETDTLQQVVDNYASAFKAESKTFLSRHADRAKASNQGGYTADKSMKFEVSVPAHLWEGVDQLWRMKEGRPFGHDPADMEQLKQVAPKLTYSAHQARSGRGRGF